MTNFRIRSLEAEEFSRLFDLSNDDLEKSGMLRMIADARPGYPCRVSLEDAQIGEEVILLNYQHHKTKSPYRGNGPIFVRKNAKTVKLDVNEIPEMLLRRLLSLRGFDQDGILLDASVVEGSHLKEQMIRMFENADIQYIHIHNAKPGCYNCVAERAD